MPKIIGAPTLDDALHALGRAVAAAEQRGEKNLIFCEDRLTLLAERAVLDAVGGTFDTEVTTFARYLSGSARVLSKHGSVMEMTALVSESKGELSCFGEGSAEVVYETIAQLSASRVTAEMLRASAEETDGLLREKLSDLACLQEKYLSFLSERGLTDESGYLSLLPEKIACGGLQQTNVCFFAFPSFTAQAQEGIRAALSSAGTVTGIFIAGKPDLYTNEGARLFRRVCEETGGAEMTMVSSTLCPEAETLRCGLFSPESFSLPPVPTDKVFAFAAEDEEEELSHIASLMKKTIAEGKRWRDIALLVPSETYFLTVEKVFSAAHIPYYADRKRPFSEHPFCSFVLNVLEAVTDGVLPAEADAVASSVYFGKADEYRNYLLKFGGFRNAVRREIKTGDVIKGYDYGALCACREKMLSVLSVFPRKGKGAAFTAGVRRLYELADGEKITQDLRSRFSGAEEKFLDLSPLEGVLAETETVSGDRTMTSREFSSMLKSGLEACKISMIPQFSDVVFVGDATDSKFSRAKVLFCAGMTDELPRVSADTAVVSDGDIRKLSDLQVQIEPAIAQVNARARESLALNLCAFSEALYVSRPLRAGGEEKEAGEAFSYLSRLFECRALPDVFPYDCSERETALLRLLSLRSDFEEGRSNDVSEYSSLYAALSEAGDGERAEKLLSGGDKRRISCGKELYFAGGSVSPTLLEQYFACPYAGFAARGLRLREREERSVMDTDAGTFVHAVLERVAHKLNELKSEEECRALARKVAQELFEGPRFSSVADTGAGKYTAERLTEEGAAVSAAMYRQLALSSFRVRSLEEEIALPDLSLRGKADRVDEAGEYVRVIDYKTGRIDASASGYYTGRKLQLELYLKGAAKGGKPAAAFYFPAADDFTKPEQVKFQMSGFYSSEREAMLLNDGTLTDGVKSALFDGTLGGGRSERGMSEADFSDFLDYSLLISAVAEREMSEGNIAPSPYDGACEYCRLRGLCAYDGEARKESRVSCSEIVRIVRKQRGDEV